MQTKVTILVENRAAHEGLIAEHGFAAWIESGSCQLLFDTGQSGAVFDNAKKLGIELSTASVIVLSHGHYDHTGGLAAAIRLAPGAQIVLHPSAILDRYSIRPDSGPRSIGMPASARRALESSTTQVRYVTAPLQLADNIFITGPIPRVNTFEDVGGPFFRDSSGLIPDPIDDDQALWVETPRGKLVVCGCAHAGIVNTMDYIQRINPATAIHTLMGGLHLLHADARRMTQTLTALETRSLARLAAGHCTGDDAIAQFAVHFNNIFSSCHAGECFYL